MSQFIVAVGIASTLIVLIFVLCIAVYSLIIVRKTYNSFNKLGFIVREDAKKYFDDASTRLIETNRQSHDQYKDIVAEATKTVLVDSGVVMEKALADAQAEAGKVILDAQKTAQRVIVSAKEQARKEYHQAINDSTQAIDWAMEQYIGTVYTQENHEEIIKKLVRQYIDERE